VTVRISEIFRSLQGEGSHVGLPCTFVRLAGCPLRCSWCDTAYALSASSGNRMPVADVVDRARALGLDFVLVTGGEPLVQPETPALLQALLDAGAGTLALETSGAYPTDGLPAAVHRILDWKCPGSGEDGRNLAENLHSLRPTDEVKFVVASRADFDWALAEIRSRDLESRCALLLSPVVSIPEGAPGGPTQSTVSATELASWMLESGVRARLQVQLHRLLWPDRERGV